MQNPTCHSCGSTGLSVFYEATGMPVASHVLTSRAKALACPRGDIRLAFCRTCGFIENLAFDPSALAASSPWERGQAASARPRTSVNDLAARLIERYDLRGKTILDIGRGEGDFLAQLCQQGGNRAVGIGPGYASGPLAGQATSGVAHLPEHHADEHAGLSADFICCRRTLERVQATSEFVRLVRKTVGPRRDTVVFFEVPDVQRVLQDLAFWDISYESCSYFSFGSLARLFRASGFDILDIGNEYDDQHLVVEACPANGGIGPYWPGENDLAALSDLAERFWESAATKIADWRAFLRRSQMRGQRLVLWGSGSKGVAFLNTLPDEAQVELVVDNDPTRQGKFIAGTGQEVVSPAFLSTYQPDVVIATDPVYCDDIRNDLDRLQLPADVVAL